MLKSDVLACQKQIWYPKFKKYCIRTEFLECTKEVLDYLTSDQTIRLPNDAGGFKEPKPDLFGQINSDEEWSDWSEDEESANQSEVIHPFPEFGQRIQKIIMGMKKRVVPKLNWSCPSDAKWQMPDNTVRCMTVNDIFLLLKSSDKINHDLTYPFEYCEDTTDDDTEGVKITLALQRFAKLKPISEFRCFVRNGMFIAFCSRDTAFHQNLPEKMDDLQPKIERFIEEEVIPNFELKSFVVDVYWKLDGTFYIFDFSPFSVPTDALYFSWEELRSMNENDEIEFRCNDGNQIVPLSNNNMLPQDVIHVANGLDVNKFVDYAKLVSEGKLDGETIQL